MDKSFYNSVRSLFLLFFIPLFFIPIKTYGELSKISDIIVMEGKDEVVVSSSLLGGFGKYFEEAIKNGFEKEITFYIEIYRIWNFWPDEFILSKKIQKTIKFDTLKNTYHATSYDGLYLEERFFDDYDKMKAWISKLEGIKVASRGLLRPNANYFVRIRADSKYKRPSPLIENLLFFIPTTDFETPWKRSTPFSLRLK